MSGEKPSCTHKQRLSFAKIISKKPFCHIIVAAWKTKFDRMRYINKSGTFYRYVFKMLLERITWYLEKNKGSAKIVCSEGTTIDIAEIRKYIQIVMKKEKNGIKEFFNPNQITSGKMSEFRMLRVADACASAYGNALNPDRKHRCRPKYAEIISAKLFCYGRKKYSYGLKVLPSDLKPFDVIDVYPFISSWLKKEE